MDRKEIDFDGEIDIVDLITSLAKILEQGGTSICIETNVCGDGNNEDGSDEFQYIETKLVSTF